MRLIIAAAGLALAVSGPAGANAQTLTDQVKTYKTGAVYEGETRNGKPDGRGVVTWPNGKRYEGEFFNGKFHGHGTFRWANGSTYTGEWSVSTRHGRGIMKWSDGSSYDGEWENGEQTGQGVYTFLDGTRFKGSFVNGKIKAGTYYHRDGRIETGEWKNGTFELARGAGTPANIGGACLDANRTTFDYHLWGNRCNDTGIDVLWRDEGSCRSRPHAKYPCSWYVGPGGGATAEFTGRVQWWECRSPELGDVVAIEGKNGEVSCLRRPPLKLSKQHQRLRANFAPINRRAERERQAGYERSERELQREMEEHDREIEDYVRRSRNQNRLMDSMTETLRSIAEQRRRAAERQRRQPSRPACRPRDVACSGSGPQYRKCLAEMAGLPICPP